MIDRAPAIAARPAACAELRARGFPAAPANAEALRAIEAWPDWAGRMLLLIGPAGSGKSHLGAIWARAARAATIEAETLGEAEPADLARAEGDPDRKRRSVGAGGGQSLPSHQSGARERLPYLLMTARGAPDGWGLKSPTFAPVCVLRRSSRWASRTRNWPARFSSSCSATGRSPSIPPSSPISRLRIDRSLGAARAIVEALDREALARGKAVTRADGGAMFKDSEDEG